MIDAPFIDTPVIDTLESRMLFALAAPLVVTGADNPDRIEITADKASGKIRVHVFGVTNKLYAPSRISRFEVSGGKGADAIAVIGVTIPCSINGNAGRDLIVGGDGNDTLVGGTGINTLSGGKGNDTVDYSNNASPLNMDIGQKPTAKAKVDFVGSDVETIFGSQFDDSLTDFSTTPVAIFGQGGDDSLKGDGDGDTLDGGAGRDTLVAGDGADATNRSPANVLLGGDDGDRLIAGPKKDSLGGGGGNDRLTPDSLGNNGDTIGGGGGHDTLDFTESTVGVNVDLGGNAGGNTYKADIEILVGSEGNDTLSSASSRDVEFKGLSGNDAITGGSGDDTLIGGPGEDSLVGGAGKDVYKSKDGEADQIEVRIIDDDVPNEIDPFGLDVNTTP